MPTVKLFKIVRNYDKYWQVIVIAHIAKMHYFIVWLEKSCPFRTHLPRAHTLAWHAINELFTAVLTVASASQCSTTLCPISRVNIILVNSRWTQQKLYGYKVSIMIITSPPPCLRVCVWGGMCVRVSGDWETQGEGVSCCALLRKASPASHYSGAERQRHAAIHLLTTVFYRIFNESVCCTMFAHLREI